MGLISKHSLEIKMTMIRSAQVEPLPLISGGVPSQTQKEMEKTNVTLAMMSAQSTADTKYDPPPPPTVTTPVVKEAFCGADPRDPSHWLVVIACLFILYGALSK
jgi:hypothetical protein